MHRPFLLGFAICLLVCNRSAAEEPPVIPVGLDAFRWWDRWAYQRIGERAYMRSTYDRSGGNEGADASHFLYQLADDFNVSLDVEGPGVLYFARYNHWHGSPWHYVVDDVDHIISETSTADPLHPAANSIFLPETLFPRGLTWTWSTTRGADLMWVPVPFETSFRMAYSRTRYGTGYYIYKQYVPEARLSQPIRSWNTRHEPAEDVVNLLARSGQDLLPKQGSPAAERLGLIERSGTVSLWPNESVSVAEIHDAPAVVRGLEFVVPADKAEEFGRARLRIRWDDRRHESVDVPVALFFGAGTLHNRDQREYLVKAFPVFVRFTTQQAHLACFFPMPFFRRAEFALVSAASTEIPEVKWRVRYARDRAPANHVGYLHATYRDIPKPEPGRDLLLLDTRGAEGSDDWSGQFIGLSWIFSHGAVLNTLEGDPRFFFDDSQTPQAQGTGTEEWGGGGDYWGGENMTLPFVGHPTGVRKPEEAKSDEDKIESAYRYLLSDLMPFGKNAVIRLEHGGRNESREHYESVAYWYGRPSASLVRTDSLQIGDEASENAHSYHSPEASDPTEIVSRYEWGVDAFDGKQIFPAHSDIGRITRGASEFTVQLDPENLGMLLRRKLDYGFPNQRARVLVADATRENPPRWKTAGIWYLAGSNRCVYSNPKDELGAAQHVIQTSNRRFRDDEFLIGRDLTRGRKQIRVRIEFLPVSIPLIPGESAAPSAWSEIRYDAYCFVMPR